MTLRNQNGARLECVPAADMLRWNKSQLHEPLAPVIEVDGCRTAAHRDEPIDDAQASEDFRYSILEADGLRMLGWA